MVVTSGSIYPVLAKHTVQREFLLFISFIGLWKRSMVLESLGGSLGDTRCVEALLGAIQFPRSSLLLISTLISSCHIASQ